MLLKPAESELKHDAPHNRHTDQQPATVTNRTAINTTEHAYAQHRTTQYTERTTHTHAQQHVARTPRTRNATTIYTANTRAIPTSTAPHHLHPVAAISNRRGTEQTETNNKHGERRQNEAKAKRRAKAGRTSGREVGEGDEAEHYYTNANNNNTSTA